MEISSHKDLFIYFLPSRVSVNVHIWGPESKTLVDSSFERVVLASSFGTNHVTESVEKGLVVGCPDPTNLGERSSQTIPGNTVKCFRPPIVSWPSKYETFA